MTVFQQQLPNDSASLIRRIEQLERDAQEARAARRLEAATIGRGGIVVQGGAIILRDAAGNEIARMGIRADLAPEPDGDPQPGFILRRNDGSVAFTLDDPNPSVHGYRQLLKMQDASGSLIFEEDYVTGWGLIAPTFSFPLFGYGNDFGKWPSVTGATFFRMFQGLVTVWNSVLKVGVNAACTTGGNTGQLQLFINGTQQGSTETVTTQADVSWEVDLSAIDGMGTGAIISVEVYARVSSGAGAIVAQPTWCFTDGATP